MRHKINWFTLLMIILTTELIGVLGSLISGNTRQLYETLTLPPFSPPGWLFGVVWPVLYLLMGIAAYLIYQSAPSPERTTSIRLYWMQLFVNFLWPIVFFRFEAYWLAVGIILVLDILVAATIVFFYKTQKTAAYLLLPYFAWILFATYLNIGVALLN